MGTLFLPTTSKRESRERWLLSGLSARGELWVDDGAASALRKQHRSLLPAGVKKVKGKFGRGDVVNIYDAEGKRIACGMVNYGAEELARIKGERSDRIPELLGYEYGDEVVHRNNLVVL